MATCIFSFMSCIMVFDKYQLKPFYINVFWFIVFVNTEARRSSVLTTINTVHSSYVSWNEESSDLFQGTYFSIHLTWRKNLRKIMSKCPDTPEYTASKLLLSNHAEFEECLSSVIPSLTILLFLQNTPSVSYSFSNLLPFLYL